MKVTVKASGVPVGNYAAEFAGAEPFTGKAEYGEGIRLKFTIVGGPHDGEESSRIVSTSTSPKSNLTKFLTALKGRKVEIDETLDFDEFVGLKGSVIVEETESGASRVALFVRDKE